MLLVAASLVEHFTGPALSLRQELAQNNAFTDELEDKFRDAMKKHKSAWSDRKPAAAETAAA